MTSWEPKVNPSGSRSCRIGLSSAYFVERSEVRIRRETQFCGITEEHYFSSASPESSNEGYPTHYECRARFSPSCIYCTNRYRSSSSPSNVDVPSCGLLHEPSSSPTRRECFTYERYHLHQHQAATTSPVDCRIPKYGGDEEFKRISDPTLTIDHEECFVEADAHDKHPELTKGENQFHRHIQEGNYRNFTEVQPLAVNFVTDEQRKWRNWNPDNVSSCHVTSCITPSATPSPTSSGGVIHERAPPRLSCHYELPIPFSSKFDSQEDEDEQNQNRSTNRVTDGSCEQETVLQFADLSNSKIKPASYDNNCLLNLETETHFQRHHQESSVNFREVNQGFSTRQSRLNGYPSRDSRPGVKLEPPSSPLTPAPSPGHQPTNPNEGYFSPDNANPLPVCQQQRKGSLQLWQFLVALLDNPTNNKVIAWTGRGMEFKLIDPEQVARQWGIQKNRPAMNYDKLSRSLRYYYEKGIMQKVAGERYVYKFVCDPDFICHQGNRDPTNRLTVEDNFDFDGSGSSVSENHYPAERLSSPSCDPNTTNYELQGVCDFGSTSYQPLACLRDLSSPVANNRSKIERERSRLSENQVYG